MKAYRLLDRARQDRRAETRAKVVAGQAWINTRFRPNLAQALATPLGTFDPALSGRFADFGGTVGDMAKRVGEMWQTPIAPEDNEFADVVFPLRPVYAAEIGGVSLLRDTCGEVVRLGDWVFLRLAGGLMCLDAQCDDYDGGARWTVEMPEATAKSRLVGQLSADGGRLALLDDTTLLSVAACSGTVLYRRSLSSLGVGEWRLSAGAGDWLAILDKQKRLACVDTSAGTAVWQIASEPLEGGFLSAQDEILMVFGAQERNQVVCFDARTGVPMSTFGLHGSRERTPFAVLTREGLAVYSEPGGKLGLRDVRLRGNPAPRVIDLGSEGWRAFCCGDGFLVACKVPGDGAIHAVDLCATNRILRLELESGRTRWPVQASIAGRRLVVLHAAKYAKGLLTDPALTAFDLPAATVAWTQRLTAEDSGTWRIAALGVCGGRMGITVVAGDRGQPCRQLVVGIGDGNLFDCSAVLGGAGQSPVSAESPVVLNGRVLMVGEQGVACLAGREP
jgi:hypothetical protein